MTLVDTHALIDRVQDDAEWAGWSEAKLFEAQQAGTLAINRVQTSPPNSFVRSAMYCSTTFSISPSTTGTTIIFGPVRGLLRAG